MSQIHTSVEQLIGNTPLLRLDRLGAQEGWKARVLAKLEYLNPGGSAKDRLALALIDDAEARGVLKPGGTIIEPTSGNTGIGLAMVAAARGYQVILTMPDSMSAERRAMLAAYGAKLVLTPGAWGCRARWTRPASWPPPSPAASSPGSSRTPPAPPPTTGPPARRSGGTRRDRWTSWWPPWAPAAPCRAPADT